MKQLLMLDEQHPSDITFLPEVNGLGAGYLFVTEEYDQHRLVVYHWDPVNGLAVQGPIFQGFPTGRPNFVFIDKVDDNYYLGIASSNSGWGHGPGKFDVCGSMRLLRPVRNGLIVDARFDKRARSPKIDGVQAKTIYEGSCPYCHLL